MNRSTSILTSLVRRGFDESKPAFPKHLGCYVRCSQCEAVVVNGIPTHEHGCPNAPKIRTCAICGYDYDARHGECCVVDGVA